MTWLELFFDLVFVVVLSRLAHGVVLHPNLDGVVTFTIQFAATFWAWNAFTYYVERFESAGLENRLFVFAAMAAVAGLALWTEGGLEEHYTGFALAYLLVRLVNMTQWARAARHVPEFRPVAVRFLLGFLVSAAVIGLAGTLDGAVRKALFALAVLIDILTPAFTLKAQARLPRLSTSKFPERFGLFTIIVLGESIVGVITGVSEINEAGRLSVTQVVAGGFGLGTGIGLWWLYFDFVARRPPKPEIGAALAWVYLHLLTLAAITVTGASITVAITESLTTLTKAGQHLLGGAVAVAMLGIAALELMLHRDDDEPTHPVGSPAIKVAAALMLALASALPIGWTAPALLVATVVALAVPAAYGVIVWYSPQNTMRSEDRYRLKAEQASAAGEGLLRAADRTDR